MRMLDISPGGDVVPLEPGWRTASRGVGVGRGRASVVRLLPGEDLSSFLIGRVLKYFYVFLCRQSYYIKNQLGHTYWFFMA